MVVVVVAPSGGTVVVGGSVVVVVVVVVAPGGAMWAARMRTIGLEILSTVSLNELAHEDPVATR